MLADHLSHWDERAGSALPWLISLVIAGVVVGVFWLVRLRRRGLPDQGPGTVGILVGVLVWAVCWARLRTETDAFADLWHAIWFQRN